MKYLFILGVLVVGLLAGAYFFKKETPANFRHDIDSINNTHLKIIHENDSINQANNILIAKLCDKITKYKHKLDSIRFLTSKQLLDSIIKHDTIIVNDSTLYLECYRTFLKLDLCKIENDTLKLTLNNKIADLKLDSIFIADLKKDTVLFKNELYLKNKEIKKYKLIAVGSGILLVLSLII